MTTDVFYSICTFGTGNLLSGGSPTIVIDGSGNAIVTLGGATQVNNIGVGVAVVYNGITSYIDSITSPTSFHLVTALGVNASSQTSTAITSINHEYASLSAFEAGFTDVNHINNTSLIAADVVVNACCYYDHDDDTSDSDCTFSGFSTDITRYLNVFTPTGGTESINSQRHNGVYSSEPGGIQAYRLESTADIILVQSGGEVYDVNFTGLQFYELNTISSIRTCISFDQGTGGVNNCIIDSCIIRMAPPAADLTRRGIYFGSLSSSGDPAINNTILYGAGGNGGTAILHAAIHQTNSAVLVNVINCTIYDWYSGINAEESTVVANCAIFNNIDDFTGVSLSVFFCASDDAQAGVGNFQITQTASDYASLVTDAPNGNFSITSRNSELYSTGIGILSTDVRGKPRSTNDIGAFAWIHEGPILISLNDAVSSFSGKKGNSSSLISDTDSALLSNLGKEGKVGVIDIQTFTDVDIAGKIGVKGNINIVLEDNNIKLFELLILGRIYQILISTITGEIIIHSD